MRLQGDERGKDSLVYKGEFSRITGRSGNFGTSQVGTVVDDRNLRVPLLLNEVRGIVTIMCAMKAKRD